MNSFKKENNNHIRNNNNNINDDSIIDNTEILEITDDLALSMSFSSNEELSDLECLNLSRQSTPQSTPESSPIPTTNIKHSNSEPISLSPSSSPTSSSSSSSSSPPSTTLIHSHSYTKYNKHETVHSQHHRDRTLVIFDWDDTLHPTSACQSGSKLDIQLIRTFCLSVYETLLTMIRLYGSSNIYIVSNADKLWIEKCLNQLSGGYFVNIYHLISLYNIQIISAKNEFSSKFPNNSTKWKQLTFEHLVQKHYLKYNQKLYLHHIKNRNHIYLHNKKPKQFSVVSIGDSQHEYIASKRVINRLNAEKINHEKQKILLHRIKLLQNPTLKQLIEQYSLIKKISYLFKSEDHEIDIDYAREMKHYLCK